MDFTSKASVCTWILCLHKITCIKGIQESWENHIPKQKCPKHFKLTSQHPNWHHSTQKFERIVQIWISRVDYIILCTCINQHCSDHMQISIAHTIPRSSHTFACGVVASRSGLICASGSSCSGPVEIILDRLSKHHSVLSHILPCTGPCLHIAHCKCTLQMYSNSKHYYTSFK